MTNSLLAAFAVGVAFGWTLEQAGLGNAPKLARQFYLTDFTVFKVMFTALVTAMLGAFWLGRLGLIDLSAIHVPETFIVPQLVGGWFSEPASSCVVYVRARHVCPQPRDGVMELRRLPESLLES